MADSTFTPPASPNQRARLGVRLGLIGLAANGLLCAGKCILGYLTGSVAILADGFNNLADAASSAITLISFRLCAKPPDEGHPYGYGRLEYLCGLFMAALILLSGLEVAKTALTRLWQPEALAFSRLTIPLLAASIAVKLALAAYGRRLSRQMASAAVQTYSTDSLIDAAATAVVLAGYCASAFTSWPLDAILGLGIALVIFTTGLSAIKSNLDPLLGQGPDDELKAAITAAVQAVPGLFGWHQLEVHDYGPAKRSLSLHVCCPETLTLAQAHALENALRSQLSAALDLEATIHLDPQTPSGGEAPYEPLTGRLPKDHFDYSKAAWLRAFHRHRPIPLCDQGQRLPRRAPLREPRPDCPRRSSSPALDRIWTENSR